MACYAVVFDSISIAPLPIFVVITMSAQKLDSSINLMAQISKIPGCFPK